MVPFIGTVCFIAGVAMSIVQRKRALLFFLFPSMLSECYYAVLLGRFQGTSSETAFWFPVIFFSVQIALIGYIVYKVKGARTAALALAVFSLSYAFCADFISTMGATNSGF
ncbi:MAG TPA: hypothetical protein VFA15_05080 [Nitrososphaera sp.]|nr:hypothetical protein [Nitrososphaera sp.]